MKRKLFLITMFIYFAISVPVKAEDEVYTEQDKKCKVWDAESQFFTYSYKTLHQEDDLPAVRKIGARQFEVNINLDSNSIKRNIRQKIRYSKYIYKENKLVINVTIVLIGLTIGFIIYIQHLEQG